MTTLCLLHIPGNDRLVLLRRVHEALPPDGIFICGDIVRPEYTKAEGIYRVIYEKVQCNPFRDHRAELQKGIDELFC